MTRSIVKTANNERFKCSPLEGWLFFHHLAEGNEIERLQLRLLFLDNNRFEMADVIERWIIRLGGSFR